MDIGINLSINGSNVIGSTGLTPPLDDYTGAQTAYSIARKLRTAYAGSAIRVRESSGDTEADIGFDADGNLDETALLAHCGSNSGYITTAYDQSGNSNDWTQSTANLQPRIVNAGTIDKVNGKPAMLSDATALSQDYISSSITSVDPSSTFIVCQTNTDRSCGFGAGGATSRYVGYIRNASASRPDINAGTPTYTVNSVAQSSTRQALYDSMLSNQVVLSVIEVDMSDANWNTLNSQVAQFDSFKPYDYQQETILYNSDMTSDRAAIEANINEYYSIY